MKFKAKLNYIAFTTKDNSEVNADKSFIFTRSQIFYNQKNRNWELHNHNITDGDYYELKVIDNIDRLKRYEIIVNKQYPLKLILDKRNEFLLKWTHKLFYIQKDSSNWLKTAIISSTVGVLMYFLGQFIGFKSGYQDGLIKAQQEIQQLDLQQPKK